MRIHIFFDSGLIINIKNGTGLICWRTHKLFKSIDFLTLLDIKWERFYGYHALLSFSKGGSDFIIYVENILKIVQ